MLHPSKNEPICFTPEQKSCIEYYGDKRKDLVIRSVAGGGKSVVLMQRALNYVMGAKITGKKKSIGLFTYNHVLADYIKESMNLKPHDEQYITVGTLHEYLNSIYFKLPGFKLGNPVYPIVKENCLKAALNEYAASNHNDKYINWGTKFWAEEFAWMHNMNVFDRGDLERYMQLEREGRAYIHRMNSEDRKAAFDIFVSFQEKMRSKKVFDDGPSGDERILYITHNPVLIPDGMRFDHVLIDEAQDQSLAKMIAMKNLARMDITISMDINQRIYEGRWKTKDLGSFISKILPCPFRCTEQIDALAESLKSHNQLKYEDEEKEKHTVPEAKGEKPVIVNCKNEDEERRFVVALIKKWIHIDKEHTIGVLCYTNEAVNKIGSWLSQDRIEFQIIGKTKDMHFSVKSPGVKLCTIHTSKGLEFMRVILPQFRQGLLPQTWALNDEEELMKQRNIAYVGMTRAMHQLTIVYSGKRSQFIDEMDSTLYISENYDEVIARAKDESIRESLQELQGSRQDGKAEEIMHERRMRRIPRSFDEIIEKMDALTMESKPAKTEVKKKPKWSF